ALGAGGVAALLFATMAKGTAPAMALAYLAPLPIFIASLSWGATTGALAAIAAGVLVAALIDPLSGALFGASIALPAWILSALSTVRSKLFGQAKDGDEKTAAVAPVGYVVSAAALVGILVGLGALISLIVLYGGYQKGVAALVAEVTPDIQEAFGDAFSLPEGMTIEEFATLFVRLSPLALAAATFLMLCANLYLGARVAQVSQALKRPWPSLPESLVLPRAMSAALVLSLILALTLRDPSRQAAWIGVGALAAAFGLQGLALAHALTRGLSFRIPLLLAIYMACALLPRWALPTVALAGLLESFLSLRTRHVAAKAKS
ncbi:MAG TPA: DUF2232 domain-containing protein, partial [Roseiarcus sp.]|nr:DUF2232 domain-containing protein [Roseiarcus sp.]